LIGIVDVDEVVAEEVEADETVCSGQSGRGYDANGGVAVLTRADLEMVNHARVRHGGRAWRKRADTSFGCLLFIQEDAGDAGVEFEQFGVVVEPSVEAP